MSARGWTIRGSRHVLKDRWLGLRADDCVMPSGHVLAPYYVLEAPDIALVLGIDEADHVILVRQYRHAYGGVSLELPGGLIDPADRDIVAAAEREMREETGYACADAEPRRHPQRRSSPLRQPHASCARSRDRRRTGSSGTRRGSGGGPRSTGQGLGASPGLDPSSAPRTPP
ncbi:NUDIX hydrolase [Methylobacterium sp. P31]